MATVRSQFFAGKAVNVPHSEHREVGEIAVVNFNEDGTAEVSNAKAEALVEFFPRLVAIDALDEAPATEEADSEEE